MITKRQLKNKINIDKSGGSANVDKKFLSVNVFTLAKVD